MTSEALADIAGEAVLYNYLLMDTVAQGSCLAAGLSVLFGFERSLFALLAQASLELEIICSLGRTQSFEQTQQVFHSELNPGPASFRLLQEHS